MDGVAEGGRLRREDFRPAAASDHHLVVGARGGRGKQRRTAEKVAFDPAQAVLFFLILVILVLLDHFD